MVLVFFAAGDGVAYDDEGLVLGQLGSSHSRIL